MNRVDGTWERSTRSGLRRRLTLRRRDGRIYLDRWGLQHPRIGAVFLHRMDAPDPGIDLHDHPWSFVSIVLWGGYVEQRADTRQACHIAAIAEGLSATRGGQHPRGELVARRPLSVRVMRLDECHTITELRRRVSWTLVLAGPVRRNWGFYLPAGYMSEPEYDRTIRAERRDLWSDQNAAVRPWTESHG